MTRPLLTIAQVIEQFEISRATVRRGIEAGKFPGAEKDAQGRWLVPVTSLVAANIKPRKTWLNGVASEHAHERAHELAQGAQKVADPNEIKVATERAHDANELAQSASRIAQLEAELDAEKRLREAAERNADDLRSAMRMLEAGKPQPHAEAPAKRRWWQRA